MSKSPTTKAIRTTFRKRVRSCIALFGARGTDFGDVRLETELGHQQNDLQRTLDARYRYVATADYAIDDSAAWRGTTRT
ncbi:hypothetical protein CHL67_02210 [Prosthecochloris sp. GSB1]|uniref:hypothetical protein n=1 Tax=Prosthecochloris sp. GSB1 TaxID=281093 RepID=UPI000B8CE4F3|nr:hypothetical protein [Prosthecochloris sp. GSB1]ASQ89888.1 hypothetical protein CHL67_02210 [Prosthecochloris sp. GSB1]